MIYVVRHGQTDMNIEGRLQGRKGVPLNKTGIQQVEQLREQLAEVEFDVVYSSPQERAIQTAEIATGMKAHIDARLDVYDLGEAEGLTKNEVKLKNGVPDPQFYKGMEDGNEYIQRIFAFMEDLEKSCKNLNVFISGHQCTTGAIEAYFHGLPLDGNILRLSSANGEYKIYDF